MKRYASIAVVAVVAVLVLGLSAVNVCQWSRQRSQSRNGVTQGSPPVVHKVLLPAHQIPDVKPGDYVRFTRQISVSYWDTGTVVKTQIEDGQFQVLIDDGLWCLWSNVPQNDVVKIDTLPERDPMLYTEFDNHMIAVNEGIKEGLKAMREGTIEQESLATAWSKPSDRN